MRIRTIFCLAALCLTMPPSVRRAEGSGAHHKLAGAPKAAAPSRQSHGPAAPSKDVLTLFNAASDGDDSRVKALLDKGTPANYQAPSGLTALILASMMNHPSTVALLLACGADVRARLHDGGYTDGTTALIAAAGESMNIMAGAKTPPPPRGYEGHEIAFMRAHPDQVRAWDARVQDWARGYGLIVRLLLDHGADPNAQTVHGDTAVDGPATDGDFDTLQFLLDRGARLDLPTHDEALGRPCVGTNGFQALIGATSMYQHSPRVVALLLAHGASPNAPSPMELTPLDRAAQSGDAQVVQMLLSAGARVNGYDGLGRTALMYARKPDVVALLKKAGAQVLPQGPHEEVTLQPVGRGPNGDRKMRVTVTQRGGPGAGSDK